MSKYVLSFCVEPLYVLESIDKAQHCGFATGLIYCTILTIIISLFLLRHFYVNKDQEKYKIKPFVVILISVLITCWIFIPLLLRYSYGNMWTGYNMYVQDFMNQGFTRQQAIALISQISSSGDINVGYIQGASSLVVAEKQKMEKEKQKNKI
jgi:hypothetical protein